MRSLQMSPEQYREHQTRLAKLKAEGLVRVVLDGQTTPSVKYKNKKVWTKEWGWFDSKKEHARWLDLRLLEASEKISGLRRQVEFEIAPGVVLDGRKRPPMRFRADHVYKEDGKEVVEDVKGYRTQGYKLKRHLMKALLGIEVKEV